MNNRISRVIAAVSLSCLSLFMASPAMSAGTVAPGDTLSFAQSDDGMRECRVADLKIGELFFLGCGQLVTVWYSTIPVPQVDIIPDLIGTSYTAAQNRVEASFSNILKLQVPWQLGIPYYASGAVHTDFSIDDLPASKNVVDAQFSIKYSWEGGIAGTGNYEGRISLSVEVEDITTDPNNPVGVGSFDLVNRDRNGDQGFTDVAAGGSAYNRNDDTASFSLKLRRGNSYRIWFKAESYGSPTAFTLVESSISARWSELSVTIDEDNDASALLLSHDQEVKDAIANHHSVVNDEHGTQDAALIQHDDDIKVLLTTLQHDIKRIKHLLHTPPGKRHRPQKKNPHRPKKYKENTKEK